MMDATKLQEIDERRAQVLRDGTAAGALRMAADDVPELVAEVRRLTAALDAVTTENNLLRSSAEVARDCAADHRAQIERITARLSAERAAAEDESRRWNEAATAATEDLARLRAEHAAALDAARREGAHEMRQRCAGFVDAHGMPMLRDAIRALPLDAPGGGS